MEKPFMNKIHFAIHDLNEKGGQDRSTLEIIRRLSVPLEIHAFTVSDEKLHPFFRPVWPNISRPVLIKIFYFYFVLWFRGKKIWHATGVSHFRSSVIHLQFLHKSWKRYRPVEDRTLFKRMYSEILELLNIAFENACFTNGKTYIAISQSVANDLAKDFGIQSNVHVVHHGVDTKKFTPLKNDVRKELGIAENEFVAIFAGSFARKGLEVLMQALAKGDFQFPLLVLGEGDRNYFEGLAKKYSLKNVRFLGKKENIQNYFQASDVFVLPTQYEPFGLVILEALACGLPVITTKLAGGAELITDSKEGFLLNDPMDADAIFHHLDFLLKNPEKRLAMAKDARKLAEANTWDHVAEKYQKILEKLL
jgi:UDP-glucose:(heptosyl)LPS alpha-1,3-glucosyltransferase